MPGQSGSENRQKQIVRTTRWDEPLFAQLQSIAEHSGCSEAEVLRRLVRRASNQILISRELVSQVTRLGNNLNQIARRLHAGGNMKGAELQAVYRELLDAVRISRS